MDDDSSKKKERGLSKGRSGSVERSRQSEGWEERRMGHCEYFLHKMKGFVIWCVVDFEGPVSKNVLDMALVGTLKRHAKLRARITDRRSFSAPPLEVFLRENPTLIVEEPEENALDVAERELSTRSLASGKGLSRLWHMFLTGRDGDHERSLVVLVNHSILDGSSLSLWLNEIKVHMNSIIEAGGTEEAGTIVQDKVVPLPLPLAFEDHISSWPEKRWRRFSLQWATQRLSIAAKSPTVPAPVKSSTQRTTRILTHWLCKEETEMLLDRIRRQGSTVASAVCAASVVAVRSLVPDRPRAHILTQINTCLRVNAIKRGTAEAMEELGQMSVPLNYVHCPDDHESVWSLANQVRKDLRQSIRTGEYFEMFKEMAYCQATSSFTFPLILRSMREKDGGRCCGVNLISLGDLDEVLPPSNGTPEAVRPCRVTAGVDVSDLGAYVSVTCLTINGTLGLCLCTAEPLVDATTARRLLDRMLRELQVESPAPVPAPIPAREAPLPSSVLPAHQAEGGAHGAASRARPPIPTLNKRMDVGSASAGGWILPKQ